MSELPRIGIGFDVHRLTPKRRLVLGGVELEYPLGLEGHSDADVLTHAVIDAVLGALGQGDIGKHFPDTEAEYKDADSLRLLEKARALADRAGCRLGNLDVTVIAQNPKLAPHLPAMKANLARVMQCEEGRINLKATTTETLGFTGRGEGIAALAVVLLAAQA